MTESAPRRWVRRAMLSALAGGGLTVGLGGALPGGALAAETPTGTSGAGEDTPPPATDTATTPKAGTPAPASSEPTTTTSTTTTESSTSAAPPSAAGIGSGAGTGSGPAAGSGSGSGVGSGQGQGEAAPVVVVQRKQTAAPRRKGAKAGGKRGSGNGAGNTGAEGTGGGTVGGTAAGGSTDANAEPTTVPKGTPNGVTAPSPLVVANQAGTLASVLGQSAVSAQALQFYRVPLFLLPIYQAAGRQYGVPWQILAAINEVETDYGNDLNVSSAGAVGWMQFMPSTWLQYGVDALGAGYADPYNPVDAIFAAARYLHAAGASSSIRRAILAYNHSNEYVESVLLRAKLIATYPQAVIANLTGLAEGNLPVAGAQVAGQSGATLPAGAASATAGAVALEPYAAANPTPGNTAPAGSTLADSASAGSASADSAPADSASVDSAPTNPTPTGPPSGLPPAPGVVGEKATRRKHHTEELRFADLLGPLGAPVTAVQDGRIAKLGHSHKLGNYLSLQDVYGDVFTYAGLGSIAHRYHVLGHHAKAQAKAEAQAETEAQPAAEEAAIPPAGMGRVRLYAHPNNPVAKVAAARNGAQSDGHGGTWLPLRQGSLVTQGTVLGHLSGTPVAASGQSTSPLQAWSSGHIGVSAQSARLRFAIRPAGDSGTVDPRPILANWRQLDTALHPKGARGDINLAGATVAQVFLMSQGELERSVLSDPGIAIDECGRQDIAAGAIDGRVLAVLEFLSRSGLKPTVGALRCGYSQLKAGDAAVHDYGDAMDITAVNGVPIAGHQGKGSITDTTIRALLTLKGRFLPHRILSLMQYPQAPHTIASAAERDRIHLDFRPQAGPLAPSTGPAAIVAASATATAAHSAGAGRTAPSPLSLTNEGLAVAGEDLSPAQWNQLVQRIGGLSEPTLSAKPNSAAIRDPQANVGNRELGARSLPGGGSEG